MFLKIRMLAVIGAMGGFVASSPAQSTGTFPPGIIAGGRPSENVSAGAVAFRSPGNMVSAGVGRVLGRHDRFFVPPDITQVAPANPQTEFLLDAIPVLFEELNRAVFTLASAILAREGIELPNLGAQLASQFGSTGLSSSSLFSGLLQKRTEHRLRTPASR